MDEQVKRRIQYEDGMTEFTVEDNQGFPVATVHTIPGKFWLCLRCNTGRCSHTIAVERSISNHTLVDAGLVRLNDLRNDPVPDPSDPVFEPAPEEETLHDHLVIEPSDPSSDEDSGADENAGSDTAPNAGSSTTSPKDGAPAESNDGTDKPAE